ncbi:MAG TPA: FAD-dependent monooxygenase [Pseudonocardiaceae bacterium]|nr:FAD-dependent monooxygenase [Pseudonocardiaceae bacterium]
MTDIDTDVLIAGGGPTGLTLAIQLARQGVPFRLIDKADEYFGGSRGDGLQPRTLEVFDDLGVLDTVLATGRTAPLMRSFRKGEVVWEGRMAEPVEATPDVPYPNTYFVPQWLTEQILRDRLAQLGGKVELGTELLGFAQDEDGVMATINQAGSARTVRARYLVGADGGRSAVRRTLGLAFVGETDDDLRLMLADVRAPGLDHEIGSVFSNTDDPMNSTAFVVFTPLYGTHPDAFVLAGTPPERDAELSLDYLRDLVARATENEPGIELTDLTWSTIWRLNVRMVELFRVGRVFLAGDAAHVYPPTGGQGLNTGVQDGYNLGWKLAAVLADGASAGLLDSYEAERLPIAKDVLRLSHELIEKQGRGDEDAHVRGPETQQLLLNYRGGPLTRELRAEPGPLRAGDRAPDGPALDANGRTVRVFDLFRGPHWTVLSRDVVVGDVGVPVYAIGADYPVSGPTVLVVRPDGYIGLAANDAGQVGEYLKTLVLG